METKQNQRGIKFEQLSYGTIFPERFRKVSFNMSEKGRKRDQICYWKNKKEENEFEKEREKGRVDDYL